MVEEVDDELRDHLVVFNLTELPELDLLANVWLIFLVRDTKYLFVLLLLLLELLQKLVLVAEDLCLFGHVCH